MLCDIFIRDNIDNMYGNIHISWGSERLSGFETIYIPKRIYRNRMVDSHRYVDGNYHLCRIRRVGGVVIAAVSKAAGLVPSQVQILHAPP